MTSSLLSLIDNSDVSPFSTIWLHVRSHTGSSVILIASHLELKLFVGEIKIYRFDEIFIFRQVLWRL